MHIDEPYNVKINLLGAPYGDILGYRRFDEEATGFTGSLKPRRELCFGSIL